MDDVNALLDAVVNLAVEKEHSEELARLFFEELNDNFKIPTISYAIFIILVQSYDMIKAQDESGATFFKGLMLDCVKGLGEME